MRIRLKPMDTHLSPLHASRGHYTRRSGGESVIVTAARSLHLSTRGFGSRPEGWCRGCIEVVDHIGLIGPHGGKARANSAVKHFYNMPGGRSQSEPEGPSSAPYEPTRGTTVLHLTPASRGNEPHITNKI